MLKFYFAPWSRASSMHWLLEELGAPYERVHVDIRAEGGVPEDYRSIQPHKKVPAIEHDGKVVTERAAMLFYLTETFPEAGLAPRPGEPERAPFLTWTVYCDSVLDPCVAARAHGYSYGSNDFSFGLFDDIVSNLERHLTKNRYGAGDRFTALDTQLASGIGYSMNMLKVLPERQVFKDYVARCEERPACRRAAAYELELAKSMPFFQEMAAAERPA